MTAYRELIERLDKATGPDADLDADIGRFALRRLPDERYIAALSRSVWRPYTGSIDTALSLVAEMLPTRDFELTLTLSNPAFSAVAHIEHWDGGEWFAQKQTAPLAILIALLHALEAQSVVKEEGA